MSAELLSVSGPGGNNANLQGTTVGGSKPLHRFINGQPKITGIVVLVLGSSFLIIYIFLMREISGLHMWMIIPPGSLLGPLFIICGILYILTEHNPTKKTVTISLALSTVTILAAFWTIFRILPEIIHEQDYVQQDLAEENVTDINYQAVFVAMGISLEGISLLYIFVGAVIFIVMSTLAGAALRSTKSQAIVVMTATRTEPAAE